MIYLKYALGEVPEGKTNYQIFNEQGTKTTITLDKWVADMLQIELIDTIHDVIQNLYLKLCEKRPDMGRKVKGNLIRFAAERKANEFQNTKKEILGWNDGDLLASL